MCNSQKLTIYVPKPPGNLVETKTYPNGLEADAIVQTYTYDLVGNVLEATDGNGKNYII